MGQIHDREEKAKKKNPSAAYSSLGGLISEANKETSGKTVGGNRLTNENSMKKET